MKADGSWTKREEHRILELALEAKLLTAAFGIVALTEESNGEDEVLKFAELLHRDWNWKTAPPRNTSGGYQPKGSGRTPLPPPKKM